MSIADVSRARELLGGDDGDDATPIDACERIVAAFDLVTGFSAALVMATDPTTDLPTGGVVDGFGPQLLAPLWDNELLDADVNKFDDVRHAAPPIATLADALDGDLRRSPRYRRLYAQLGASDELRVSFVASRTPAGVGVFVRDADQGRFDAGDLAAVSQLLPPAAALLRRANERSWHAVAAPVVAIVDHAGDIRASSRPVRGRHERDHVDLDRPDVATAIRDAAARCRPVPHAADGLAGEPAITLVPWHAGEMLRVRASPLERDDAVVVSVERVGPIDLVSAALRAHGLDTHEIDLAMRLLRGQPITQIADDLMLSPRAVERRVGTTYERLGVRSRLELVAHVFDGDRLDNLPHIVRYRSRSG